jgi:hypothetical protein
MVKLKDLLAENTKISITSADADKEGFVSIPDLKTKLSKEMGNIEIDNAALEEKRNGRSKNHFKTTETNRKKIKKEGVKIPLKCAKHPEEDLKPLTVKDLNAMFSRLNNAKRDPESPLSGSLNPCPQCNRITKDEILISRGKEPKGNLQSSQERTAYDTLLDIKNHVKGILDQPEYEKRFGNKVYPIGRTGPKKKVLVNGSNRDLDIFIEYENGSLAKKLDTKNSGIAFVLDGGPHNALNAGRSVFAADVDRNHITGMHVYRISYSGNKDISEEEKEKIIEAIHNIIDELAKEIDRQANKKPFERKKDYFSQIQHAERKANKDESLQKLITHIRVRREDIGRHSANKNLEFTYTDKNGRKASLDNFLSSQEGRRSYHKNEPLWHELVQATPKETKAWKEKHQAKNGEKLFSKDKDGNVKLFENKESSV